MTEPQQPPDPTDEGQVVVSFEARGVVLKQQRDSALDDAANWKAAYMELAQRYNNDVGMLQRQTVELRSLLAASGFQEATVIDGGEQVPGMHAVTRMRAVGDEPPPEVIEGLSDAVSEAVSAPVRARRGKGDTT